MVVRNMEVNAEKYAKSLQQLDKQTLQVEFYRTILNHYFETISQEIRNIDFALMSGCFTNEVINDLVGEKWDLQSVLEEVRYRLQEINM